MRNYLRLLLAAVLPLMIAPAALAQAPAPASPPPVPDGPAYIVSYFETTPTSALQARTLLANLARASRKDAGNLQFITLQRIGAPNHFALLETWKDKEAQAAHAGAAHTKEFREKLQSHLRSPYDERPHFTFASDVPSAKPVKSAVYVVTHVDIVPTSKDIGLDMIKSLTAASRKDAGMIEYNALQQASRPNHVTLVEIWKDNKALDSHGISPHMKDFRAKFMPLSGSLYDERLYKVVE
jgi:quinol monooxygenase YgiN